MLVNFPQKITSVRGSAQDPIFAAPIPKLYDLSAVSWFSGFYKQAALLSIVYATFSFSPAKIYKRRAKWGSSIKNRNGLLELSSRFNSRSRYKIAGPSRSILSLISVLCLKSIHNVRLLQKCICFDPTQLRCWDRILGGKIVHFWPHVHNFIKSAVDVVS